MYVYLDCAHKVLSINSKNYKINVNLSEPVHLSAAVYLESTNKGFLSFKDPSIDIPGNAGLKDQVLALKWIKANCSRFGGDSNNITIFGESAGGASVHYMMMTEQTRELFHKAIMMSGSSLTPWATVSIENSTSRLAKLAGYKGNQADEQALYKYYKAVKGTDLLRVEHNILSWDERRNRSLLPFAPCIEPYINESCVVPEHPRLMMRKAWSNKKVPLLIGGASYEGLFVLPESKRNPQFLDMLNDCEYIVPLDLKLDRESEHCRELGLRLKKTHYGDKQPNSKNAEQYYDMMGYYYFWHAVHRTILARLEYSLASTYLYRFNFDSPTFNHFRILWCGPDVQGTCHGDDISYLFYNALAHDISKDSKEYKTIQRMIGSFVNFARFGNPNNEAIEPVIWLPLQKGQKPFKCLDISDEVGFIDLPEEKKLGVWDSLYTPDALI